MSTLHGYLLLLTSLLVLMGIATFTSKEFVIFCRVSKIGNEMGYTGIPLNGNSTEEHCDNPMGTLFSDKPT